MLNIKKVARSQSLVLHFEVTKKLYEDSEVKNAFVQYVYKLWGFGESFAPRSGPGSSVGIATGYELDGPGIESHWGARFFAPVQTGPGAHPASCTMCTGSFLGLKSGRVVTLTPHLLLVPWS
jgi:hypothetical protein